ncbi:MAG: glycosyltransferase family 25 protein [Hyphomicrobiaceae bacterium]|nr:glycosyltransferase family 25 protein [Hyphomicrobiaceae bacterium]
MNGKKNKTWRAFMINLDYCADRLQVVGKRLDDLNIPWERVVGVNGREMRDEDYVGIDKQGFLLAHGRHIEPGDIGCYLSHIRALQAFLASGEDFGLILEDDVDFDDDFLELMDKMLESSAHWDVLKLSGRHQGMPVPLRKLGNKHRLVAFFTRHTGAAAYLVSRFAARRYIERLLPMHVPFDHVFDRAWHFGFRFRGVLPLPVSAQNFAYSTISTKHKLRKPPLYILPKLAHRTVNETRRGAHYIFRGLVIPRCSLPPR